MTPTSPGRVTPVSGLGDKLIQSSIRCRHLNSPRPRVSATTTALVGASNIPDDLTGSWSPESDHAQSLLRTPHSLLPAVFLDDAPTRPERSSKRWPCSSPALPRATVDPPETGFKRNSLQRRLDALRLLVADLDFNQPWSQSGSQPQTPNTRDPLEDCSETSSPVYPATLQHKVNRQQTGPEPFETKRVDILREMCETEHAFVRSVRTVLRLFAAPLKTPRGDWISGIPHRVTQLMDQLAAIHLAHAVLSDSLREVQEAPQIEKVLEAFQLWIPRLYGHEWYLVHFEHIAALIEHSTRDNDSVYGEFVRMQTKNEDMGAMSLGSMLLKPVQRLMQYPLFWKRLLDVTPHQHSAHSKLLRSLAETESIILALQSAKGKEEDYQELEALEKRLHFDRPFRLAIRGRKLLGQGVVTRLQGRELAPVSLARASSLSSRSSVSSISSIWDTRNSVVSSQSSCSRSGSIKGLTRSSSSNSMTDGRRRRDELQMFVFDDLIVLASLRETVFKSRKDRTWKVLPEHEGGYGKLVEAKNWSGWGGEVCVDVAYAGHATLFTITLPLATVCLSLPVQTKTRISLSCPFLMSMPQMMSVLAQAGEGNEIEYAEEIYYGVAT